VSRQLAAWLGIALLMASFAGCATTNKQIPDLQQLQARAAYERGWGHIERKEASLALTAIQEAISLDGAVPVYWNALGWIYLQLGRPDLALAPFAHAVELDGTYAEGQMNVGVAHAEMGQWQEALAAYRKAVSLPTLSRPHTAYQNMGVALLNLKRYREAEEALGFAISLEPKLEAAYYNLGLIYAAQNRPEEAKAAFRRVRDLSPQSPFGQAASERLRAMGDGG